jgi:hypothetical protein
MKKVICLWFLAVALCTLPTMQSFGQLLPELNYPKVQFEPKEWPSFWINCPDAPQSDYAVTLYRRTFEVQEKPGKFIVHVSADNPYKLFINGKLASMGPQLSNPRHWRYETIDIGPYLNKGTNTLAAYFSRYNYFLQMSKLGLGDDIDMLLNIWKDLIPLNLTTTPERVARQRSEAHPWSASPASAFINVIAGINPAEPGFVNRQPHPGSKYIYKDGNFASFTGWALEGALENLNQNN